MTGYLRFEEKDGYPVLIEVEAGPDPAPEDDGTEEAGLRDRTRAGIIATVESLETAVSRTVRHACEPFVRLLGEMDPAPSEAEISFGLKAVGEAGAVAVGKVSGDVNFMVRLVWRGSGQVDAGGNTGATGGQ